ncbi:hypothetical protein MSAN_01955400 [Mycena sanguinolenta]|uniref:Uncharacterized protein n=1 Tax=Mycena sanguinolenta TaxID=230812 RepID=A0A8H6XM24_9AGAR|nr:hypothetical protein MSAN_01955400 [Mycena sanguinolenta]
MTAGLDLLITMDSDVSTVSNETSILTSLDNLLSPTVVRVLLASAFALTIVLYLLRGTTRSKATDELERVTYTTELIYYRSVEAGLLGECHAEMHKELSQLQTKASELREQSLGASVSSWDGVKAFCCGLSFKILRCTKDARKLKTKIEIAVEKGLRSTNKDGEAHFLLTVAHPHVARLHCNCQL